MSPTLYTARNNGRRNNGGNTTMVIGTTMTNNGMQCGGIQSMFPCFHHGQPWTELVLEKGGLAAMRWDIQGIM